MLKRYYTFFTNNWPPLMYSYLHSFGSSMGQTFLLASFVPFLRADLGMNAGDFGIIYGTATLLSAACLMLLAFILDRYDMRLITVVTSILLMIGAYMFTHCEELIFIGVSIFLLRFAGQGMMSKISSVGTSRYFVTDRGKAVSITGMGWPTGEILLPGTAILLMGIFSWQSTFLMMTSLMVAIVLIVGLLLIWKYDEFYDPEKNAAKVEREHGGSIQHYTPWAVLKTPYYIMTLPYGIINPFLVTCLFLFQGTVATYKGWDVEVMIAGLSYYGLIRLLVGLYGGDLVDRFTARRLYPFSKMPLVLGVGILWMAESQYWLFAYLTILGGCVGMSGTANNALWAELYGTRYLATIKSIAMFVGIGASALGPMIIGYFLKIHIDVGTLLFWAMIYISAASVLAYLAPYPKHLAPRRTKKEKI
ncbi:MAG: MFS transporter [Alphaproteobacteria bacterium]|nr:MFS transporter [Alphaproteobacteria bacterium]